MKIVKLALFCVAMASVAFFAGCTDENPNNGKKKTDTTVQDACDVFCEQFDARATAVWSATGENKYNVTFGDNTSLDLNEDDVVIVDCTSQVWPQIEVRDGQWWVDGSQMGVSKTDDPDDERIVSVLYESDNEAVFVQLSSGRMLFFHKGKTLDVARFVFERSLNPTLSRDVVCQVDGTQIKGRLDPRMLDYNLTASVVCRGSVSWTTAQNYGGNVKFSCNGTAYTVTMTHSGAIPKITITTGTPYSSSYIDQINYRQGSIKIEDPSMLFADKAVETLDVEIKGRGNTSWTDAKKSYKIKLAEEREFMGMPANKHFVLLATPQDRTLLRNSLAYRLSEIAQMQWAPRWVPVEFWLDGSFRGLFMLVEQVRTGPWRIDVDLAGPGDNTYPMIEGGYLFLIDNKRTIRDRNSYTIDFDNSRDVYGWVLRPNTAPSGGYEGIQVNFNQPEDPTATQFNWAKKYIGAQNDGSTISIDYILRNGTYAQISQAIDTRSFIRYFFVNEIAKNIDGNMRLSTYVAKPRYGKLYLPCVWDFDLAFGQATSHNIEQAGADDSSSGWYIRNSNWMRELFAHDEFCAEVKTEWATLYPKLADIEDEVQLWAALIADARVRNFTTAANNGQQGTGTGWGSSVNYASELDKMLTFMRERIAWMNTEITAGRHKYN